MAAVEIDEAELLRLKKLEEHVVPLLRNPSARKKLAAAVKEVRPDDPLAKEVDQVDPNEQRFAQLEKQLADERKAREESDHKRTQEASLSALRQQREQGFAKLRQQQWTDDGIKAVEKLMEEKGILDPLDAAAIYEKYNPPATPIMPSHGGAWNFMQPPAETDVDLKALIASKGEDHPLVDRMAMTAIQEVRGQQPRR